MVGRLSTQRLIVLMATIPVALAACSHASEQGATEPVLPVASSQSSESVVGIPRDTSPAKPSSGPSDSGHLETTTSSATETPELAGMWDAGMSLEDYEKEVLVGCCHYEGVLVIEFPCVYLDYEEHVVALYPDPDATAESRSDIPGLHSKRFFLGLAREWTRYNTETESLWSRGEGLMLSGDRVDVSAYPSDSQNQQDSCPNDVELTADHVWLCPRHDCRIERETRRQGLTDGLPVVD